MSNAPSFECVGGPCDGDFLEAFPPMNWRRIPLEKPRLVATPDEILNPVVLRSGVYRIGRNRNRDVFLWCGEE